MSKQTTEFGLPKYGLTRNIGPGAYGDVRARVEAALKAEGCGVLTEIDIQATLKAKLGHDFRPYVILGACNPALALEALGAELPVGLLLPCNVVLTQEESGDWLVSAVDPVAMLSVTGRDDVRPLAEAVKARLERVVAA